MSELTPTNFFSGLSGIVLPVPKYQFPPAYQKTSRLTYYTTFFNSIEVNSTFYAIPRKETIERWASSVSENFRFTFKLFKEITHIKDLNFDAGNVSKFIMTITGMGVQPGCILVQFPPGLTSNNFYQLEELLKSIRVGDTGSKWHVAVEFRNKGWYNEDVYGLLKSYSATLVIHDMPASKTPLVESWSDIIYVRFHGPTGNYRESYPDSFLHEYAEYIKCWLREGKTVYVYFNNTAGDAFNNLVSLNSFMLID